MIKYATFIEAVGAQAGAADTEEARRAVEAVIAAVAASLEECDRDRLAAVLPGSLRGAAEIRGQALHPDSGAALVSAVSAASGCPAERARFYTQGGDEHTGCGAPSCSRPSASGHYGVEQLRDTITFEIWTHSLDRVTDMDSSSPGGSRRRSPRSGPHGRPAHGPPDTDGPDQEGNLRDRSDHP